MSDYEHGVSLWTISFNLLILTILLYYSFLDVWYVLTCLLFAVPVIAGFVFVGWFSVSIDRAFNPWVESLDLDVWSWFTTKHYTTWLYYTDPKAWLSQQLLVLHSIALFFVTIFIFQELVGGLLMMGDLFFSILLLILVHIKWRRLFQRSKYSDK